MSYTHEAADACVDHPELPASRECVACGRGFCDYCGDTPLVQRKETARPPVVCRHCSERVRPWVWNPFAFDRDEEPGEHLAQALWSPRTAMLRAGYGKLPASALALIAGLGSLGTSWVGVELFIGPDPDVVAFARFGYGIAWSFVPLAILFTFALCLHALQPSGPGRPATLRQTVQVVATAFTGPGTTALCAGLAGYLSANLWQSEVGLYAAAACCVLAFGWGTLVAGWGMAVRRGGSTVMGLLSSVGALLFVAALAALVIGILIAPPWETGWENTSFGSIDS